MSTLRARVARAPADRPLVTLAAAVLVVEAVGASGAVFTAQGLGAWYESLARPALAPPNWVFGPVWTALFALLGGALWLVWRRAEAAPGAVRVAAAVFGVQFAFNLAWSAAFFGARAIGAALAVIAVLWVGIVATAWAFARVDRRAAALVAPYLLWVSFAAWLNYRFWVLN